MALSASATTRIWIGASVLGLLDVGLALGGTFLRNWSPWLVLPILLLAAVGVTLTYPGRSGVSRSGAVFIRGDASGSRFDNVRADNTAVFIDGNAIGAIFNKIKFNVGAAPRGWPYILTVVLLLGIAVALAAAMYLRG